MCPDPVGCSITTAARRASCGVGRVTLTLCDNPTVTVFGVSAIEQIDDLAYGIASTTVGYPDAEADIQETRNVSLREQLAGERLGQPLLVACR